MRIPHWETAGNVACGSDADSVGVVELPGAGAKGAPLREKNTFACELLDAVVAGVGNVNVAVGVDLDPVRPGKLAISKPVGTPLEDEGRRVLDGPCAGAEKD